MKTISVLVVAFTDLDDRVLRQHALRAEEVAVAIERRRRQNDVVPLDETAARAEQRETVRDARLHVSGARHKAVVRAEVGVNADDGVVKAEVAAGPVDDRVEHRRGARDAGLPRGAGHRLELREIEPAENDLGIGTHHAILAQAAHPLAEQQSRRGLRTVVAAQSHDIDERT
jgi:hypothetical protein